VTSRLIDTKFISKINQTITETQQLFAKLYYPFVNSIYGNSVVPSARCQTFVYTPAMIQTKNYINTTKMM